MAIIWFSEYLLIGISQHVFFISLKMLRFLILFGKSCDILDTTEFWNKTDLGLKTNSALDWHVSLAKTGQCLGLFTCLSHGDDNASCHITEKVYRRMYVKYPTVSGTQEVLIDSTPRQCFGRTCWADSSWPSSPQLWPGRGAASAL